MPREYDYQYGRERTKDDRVNNPPPFDLWKNLGAPFRGLAPAFEGIGRSLAEVGQGISSRFPATKNIPTNWWEVGAGATPQYVPAYTGPLVVLTNDETQRRYDTPLVRYTNDRTRPDDRQRSMAYGPAAPEQGYAPEFFGPPGSLGGERQAEDAGYAFPEWEGGNGGGYGRANYGPGYGGYDRAVYEQPKPQPRRYDYGLTSWHF